MRTLLATLFLTHYRRKLVKTRARAIRALRKERIEWRRATGELRHKIAKCKRQIPQKPTTPQLDTALGTNNGANVAGIRRAIGKVKFVAA